ncbi:hypothetical protein PSH81_20230 [Pseudomonas sp. FP2335]|uniref:hypothetical protein n=1 Tax=Pseudomonas sp. FP2335 TaxID=2954092 RepID=UPI0027334C11|nr:hypothetical protein [Pseudomonas sp. FP2335]WLH78047.1 hypothetical protein PSH81_20230 [Pseudomonas sp. FP2335]
MLEIGENKFRDYLFENHKEDFFSLVVGRREPKEWVGDDFPPVHFLLQRKAERKINEILDQLEVLVLTAKELRLEQSGPHPTRIDLFGCSESSGITIIELKKSEQTERQAFTELLAYANHFCSVFPGVNESAITSLLVAPMKGRTVKDAYVQELLLNGKNILALMPFEKEGRFFLEVFYPEASYYQWFENNIFNDHSMMCVTISFPLLPGWIDSDIGCAGSPPQYTVDALNQISNAVAHKLEGQGIHAIVYATQKWGEMASFFPYPNTLVVAAMNPFSSVRTTTDKGRIVGRSAQGRLAQVQAIYDQLTDEGKNYFWVESMESDFLGRLIRAVRDQVKLCLLNNNGEVDLEIGIPDWYGLKTSMVDAVFTHNLEAYTTGLLREIYLENITYGFERGEQSVMFGYQMLTPFLAVWEICRGFGYEEPIE